MSHVQVSTILTVNNVFSIKKVTGKSDTDDKLHSYLILTYRIVRYHLRLEFLTFFNIICFGMILDSYSYLSNKRAFSRKKNPSFPQIFMYIENFTLPTSTAGKQVFFYTVRKIVLKLQLYLDFKTILLKFRKATHHLF